MYGPKREKPSPSREVIERALLALDGGPAPVGPIAFGVCDLMQVDTTGARGSYDLRGLISWSGLLKELKDMTAAGLLVVRSRQEWHDLTAGVLFPSVGHAATQAYCLASVAAGLTQAVGRTVRRTGDARREAARQKAQARVLIEHRADVERYMREWLRENPEDSGG